MSRLPNADRVRIWNTFFSDAWQSAKNLHEIRTGRPSRRTFKPLGGALSTEQRAILQTLTQCTLAIEARANHLIDELVERGRLSELEASAVQRLPPQQKWFLLPKLYGSRRKLRSDVAPHQAVADICSKRNALVHVSFRRLSDQLPSSAKMQTLFEQFVHAVADMNVVLRRSRRIKKRLLQISEF